MPANMSTAVQVNWQTSEEFKIRKVEQTAPTGWAWQDGSGHWHSYEYLPAQKIHAAYESKQNKVCPMPHAPYHCPLPDSCHWLCPFASCIFCIAAQPEFSLWGNFRQFHGGWCSPPPPPSSTQRRDSQAQRRRSTYLVPLLAPFAREIRCGWTLRNTEFVPQSRPATASTTNSLRSASLWHNGFCVWPFSAKAAENNQNAAAQKWPKWPKIIFPLIDCKCVGGSTQILIVINLRWL